MTDPGLYEFILNCERSVWQAVVAKDGDALSDLFSEEYIEITLAGLRVLKSEVVAESPEIDEIDSYLIDSARVVAASADCAILSYHLTIEGTCRGVPVLPKDRWVTSVWSRVGGAWKCSLFQQSHYDGAKGRNPWLSIPADEYDIHLAHPSVMQREFLDAVFADVLIEYEPQSLALLGCATGGGLQYVDADQVQRIVAVDLNSEYLEATRLRYADRLPQLQLVNVDLEACEFDTASFELIHIALVLEYVDAAVVLEKAARWLAPEGVLVVVLQLASDEVAAVSETGCESLKLLAPLMKLHDPNDIRKVASDVSLTEVNSTVERLDSGKQFYIGHFRCSSSQR